MNSFVLVALFAAFSAANAGILPAAPLVSAYSAAPLLSAYSASPLVSSVVSPVVSAYSAPVVAGGLVGEQTVVAGPSGTVSRTIAAPGVAAYGAGVAAYGAGVAAYGAPLVSSYASPSLVARTIW